MILLVGIFKASKIIKYICRKSDPTCWGIQGDFEESDAQFRSRPRGGRKRNYSVIESLMRKRVVPPSESELVMNNRDDHRSWPFSSESGYS